MEYRYDPKETYYAGHYECETCGASFYGGGKAMHRKTCLKYEAGYDSCVFVFGDELANEVIDRAREYKDLTDNYEDVGHPLAPLSVTILRQHSPQFLDGVIF